MRFNDHSKLVGAHAFLSASKYHWINYDDEKLDRVFLASMAARRGSDLHALALDLIRLNVKLPNNNKTINRYVNDAIGYRMRPEQVLFYSENAFGTCDAISFRKDLLRIHDLTGVLHPGSVHQLEVYAALFCLEYRVKPHEIQIELRIYQSDDVKIFEADPDVIVHIMDRIVSFDKRITAIRLEADL
jgi:hypothetical protein